MGSPAELEPTGHSLGSGVEVTEERDEGWLKFESHHGGGATQDTPGLALSHRASQ